MPTASQVLKELAALGNENNLRTYARHGISAPGFGVPYADLYKLQKKLGVDQPLAVALWRTGNHDGRVLAGLICDPSMMKVSDLDAWAKTVDNMLMQHAVSDVALRSKFARARAEKWIESRSEWQAATGWHMIGHLGADPGAFSDKEAEALLARIESEISGERNRVKHSMNFALITMSTRSAGMCKLCVAAAKRIGKVKVDHGETSCKTPDAIPYIKKLVDRAKKKKATKKTSKQKVRAAK
jgi:3-methyladenine DNA glycosylase AlkD